MAKTLAPGYTSIKSENRSIYYKVVSNLLSKMNKGKLKILHPNGEVSIFGDDENSIHAEIRLNNYELFKKIILFGDIGFGESYVDGDWDTPDITSVISWMIINIENNPSISGSRVKFTPTSLLKVFNKIMHKLNENSLTGSKKNISAHYDLSNDFFKLFLDDTMTYSSAYFKNETESLKYAQENKYKNICEELKLSKDDYVLEIGSGWGGFSIYAAENYGCKIKTITISEQQFALAKERIKNKKLDTLINIELIDYRKLEGKFDKIVSIEMLEAVGHKYLSTYFAKLNSLLKPDGSVALQVITSPDSRYNEFRKNVDWIQKYIFPGSLLPSVSAINKAVNKTSNMHLHSMLNIGKDYAKTLSVWRNNFNNSKENILSMGFNNEFIRKWNYYFSYCEAAFTMRNINVLQMIYTRPNNIKL